MFHDIAQQNEYLMTKDLQWQLKIDGTETHYQFLNQDSGVERGNLALKYTKRASRSIMDEERLNAILLLHVCHIR